jgi:hypothetical protein
MPETATAVREISFADAIREALSEEMRRDPTVFVIGEDVAEAGTPFKVVKGSSTNSARRASSTRRYPRRDSRGWLLGRRWQACGQSSTSCSATS